MFAGFERMQSKVRKYQQEMVEVLYHHFLYERRYPATKGSATRVGDGLNWLLERSEPGDAMMASPATEKAKQLDEDQESSRDVLQPLVPADQQTLYFYGKPLVVVRLPDGRVG